MQTKEQTREKPLKLNVYKMIGIYFINNEKKTYRIKKQKVYGLDKTIKDLTGKEYQLFTQDELKFYVDIPINDPNIGVIIDGIFWSIATTSNYRNKFIKLKEMLGTKDLSNATIRAMETVKNFTQEIGE